MTVKEAIPFRAIYRWLKKNSKITYSWNFPDCISPDGPPRPPSQHLASHETPAENGTNTALTNEDGAL